MFTKILIANRGAIACRIIRTLKIMGIQSVAIYSDADANSLHVQQADHTVHLPGIAATDTYLDIDKVLQAAKQSGAQAIHPGYGFLSENTTFARRCEKENIVFIGPTPEQIEQFGLKHEARRLAEANQIPLITGSPLLDNIDGAIDFAKMINYPLMLKSTAGGGGIGMQVCNSEKDLREAFDRVKRLSQNNFGNDGIFLEKFIAHARHIEVQLVGDGLGNIVSLGERDCSLQRRNQKVIEEAPAPHLDESTRQSMFVAAKKLAASVNYRSAGTVEFIYDVDTQGYYFLEMNTRLQVEHGVTESICGVDLVEWMVAIAAGDNHALLSYKHQPQGHAIQARLYAEDPGKDFQPSSGLLTYVSFPEDCRCDHFIEAGFDVPAYYDPMLAKIIAHTDTRQEAIDKLANGLNLTQIEGIVSNRHYLHSVLQASDVQAGKATTAWLNHFSYQGTGLEILQAGTLSTVQDYPGRTGYWDVGIPPSGPMDTLAFQLGNRLLNNPEGAAGLEMTLTGPSIRFRCNTVIALTGAHMVAKLDGQALPYWRTIQVKQGAVLELGQLDGAGMRTYLCVKGGIHVHDYLGSKSTFTLGQFGGYGGRQLQVGDVLAIQENTKTTKPQLLSQDAIPKYNHHWDIHVIYGPHGAPDFFTDNDIDTFFAQDWEIHFNSSRTGVRLIGPKPQWSREDGGEAGLHPSNIHDNAYAIGAVDFTGDMPVILGPDGPSLGGFVCPVTITKTDLWKTGQLKPGDTIRFIPVDYPIADQREREQRTWIEQVGNQNISQPVPSVSHQFSDTNAINNIANASPVLARLEETESRPQVLYRIAGEDNILIEYGPLELDLMLRFRVHALMLRLQAIQGNGALNGIIDLTPGIRSLQIHFDNQILARSYLLTLLQECENELGNTHNMRVPTRTVYLPLSWDDPSTQVAIDKYMTTVNPDAPWCPSNIEFIRRINGLDSIEEVKRTVFDASYLVMGLGDVYLGAPVATPLDPRHRLVTTKYNPARTWTPENAVGIGGAYMCVYGMEGPGGYQFVGRTIQMWNRYHKTDNFPQPWLLRFFDQIRFYEVSHDELQTMRRDFLLGRFSIKIEESEFNLAEYDKFLSEHATSIDHFQNSQRQAFNEERARWQSAGLTFDTVEAGDIQAQGDVTLAENETAIISSVPGSLWRLEVEEGQVLGEGDTVAIIESMKMEFPVACEKRGRVKHIHVTQGQQLKAGQLLLIVEGLS
ncbi:MAG: urea carboxylase [Cellvibrionaceae bacterium]